MPLLPTTQARARQQEKIILVLRFLRTAIYSTSDILGELLGITHRSTILDSLKLMQQAHLVRSEQFSEMGNTITLWGITAAGQHLAIQGGEEPNHAVFNSSKISVSNLLHYLDMQRVHLRAQKSHWSNFQYVDRLRRQNPSPSQDRASAIRPDLIATNPDGHIAALEMERTRKSEHRYKTEVIPGHVRNLNANQYEFVVWISRTPHQQKELYELFQKIVNDLRTEQKWFLNVPSRSFKPFQFANLETWPQD